MYWGAGGGCLGLVAGNDAWGARVRLTWRSATERPQLGRPGCCRDADEDWLEF